MDLFASNIKFLRTEKGLTQVGCAAAIGVQRSTWSGYEHGWSKPNFNDLSNIVELFDVSFSELLETDLSKLNLNDVLEYRKVLKILNPNLKVSLNPNFQNGTNEGKVKKGSSAGNPVVLKQLSRMEDEIRQLRSKLGQ